MADEKVLSKRELYLANMGKRESLIRTQIKDLKRNMKNAKFFMNALDFADERVKKDALLSAEGARIAIKTLRKELHRERIKGVPIVKDVEVYDDEDLHCKKCGWTVMDKDQDFTINFCPNCGRLLDWTGWF